MVWRLVRLGCSTVGSDAIHQVHVRHVKFEEGLVEKDLDNNYKLSGAAGGLQQPCDTSSSFTKVQKKFITDNDDDDDDDDETAKSFLDALMPEGGDGEGFQEDASV